MRPATTTSGVSRSLVYARRHKIEHVVFTIDSQGGDQVEASKIYDLLAKYDEHMTFHAVIRDAVGVAVAIPVWCKNLFLRPGANLGGLVLTFDRDRYDGDPDIAGP